MYSEIGDVVRIRNCYAMKSDDRRFLIGEECVVMSIENSFASPTLGRLMMLKPEKLLDQKKIQNSGMGAAAPNWYIRVYENEVDMVSNVIE